MFAKKRSIIKLQEILNPTYQLEFKINNEKYRIDVDSKIIINLNKAKFSSLHQDLFSKGVEVADSLYRVTINKVNEDGYFSFEDYKEFHNYEDTVNYIMTWKEKAD